MVKKQTLQKWLKIFSQTLFFGFLYWGWVIVNFYLNWWIGTWGQPYDITIVGAVIIFFLFTIWREYHV